MGMRIVTAATAAALLVTMPAMAQMSNGSMSSDQMSSGSMSSGSKMKMSMADKKMMAKCKGMSHDMMMKNKGCMKMMKMHPDMMPSS